MSTTEPEAEQAITDDTDQVTADDQLADEASPDEASPDEASPDEASPDEASPDEPAPLNRSGRNGLALPVALLLVAVVFIGLGVAFEIRAHSIRSQSSASNHALVDTAATSELVGQVSTALNKVLSYQYANPSATQQAAAQLLTGDAAGQYQTLFTALQQKAPGEKLTLQAKVVTAGVTSLHGNTAQLLVFLDQSSTRASDKQSSTSAAQLDITAVKQGGTWKISELRPL